MPILTWTNENIQKHIKKVLEIPGSKILFGGNELKDHKIPSCYGAFEPTALFVPLNELTKQEHFLVATTELFGPFQIVTEY